MYMKCKIGRREVFFSNHALDRYWERYIDQNPHAGRQQCRETLEGELQEARLDRVQPPWTRMSRWHAARCEYVLMLPGDDRCFVVNKNPGGDLVASTYLFNRRELAHA